MEITDNRIDTGKAFDPRIADFYTSMFEHSAHPRKVGSS